MFDIWIEEIIWKNGRAIDTVCRMDGIRSHMDPETLVRIHEEHGKVMNIEELIVRDY